MYVLLHFKRLLIPLKKETLGPGTSPTSINTIQAFFFAPLVYVDSKPQDPSKEYSARGMTLVIVTAPDSGPVATRRGDLTIPGTEVAFGGFSTLIGRKSTKDSSDRDRNDLDVYLFGMSEIGLQLARVGINEIESWDKYKFWDPQEYTFSKNAPKLNSKDPLLAYMTGTFSSGSIFYSPYLDTFLMVYFNKMTDSTFYIRYLDLEQPLQDDETWIKQGKNGKGIEAEDVEALASYKWSDEQALYASKPGMPPLSICWTSFLPADCIFLGPGGFNYAGIAHPEYFNRQYFASVRFICSHKMLLSNDIFHCSLSTLKARSQNINVIIGTGQLLCQKSKQGKMESTCCSVGRLKEVFS